MEDGSQRGFLFPSVAAADTVEPKEHQDWLNLSSFKLENNAINLEKDEREFDLDSEIPGPSKVDKRFTVLAFEDDIKAPEDYSHSEHDQRDHAQHPKKRKRDKKKEHFKNDNGHFKKGRNKVQYYGMDKSRKVRKLYSDNLVETVKDMEIPVKLDRQPDENNLLFGSLYKLDVVDFFKKPFICLGLKDTQQMIWDLPRNGKKIKNKHESRYFKEHEAVNDKSNVTSSLGPLLYMNPTAKHFGLLKDEDFISLTSSDVDLSQGRSSTEIIFKSEDPITISPSVAYAQTLHKKLANEPSNIDLWLDFISIQDKCVDAKDESGFWAVSHSAKLKTVVEKKLSILEKAIQLNPRAWKLLSLQMHLSERLKDYDSLSSLWKEMVFKHPNSTLLWAEFLKFHLSHFSQFTVSKCATHFSRCFSVLGGLLDGTFVSHSPESETSSKTIGIFSQYIHFLIHAGYTERATASIQALIEFNLFVPSDLKTATCRMRKDFFEPFWDQSVPRFGDENARGWSRWHASKNKMKADGQKIKSVGLSEILRNAYQTKDALQQVQSQEQALHDTWLRIEYTRSSNCWRAANRHAVTGSMEDEIDDPDRVVLYDDLCSCLFKIDNEQEQFLLILLLLSVLGVFVPDSMFDKFIDSSTYLQCATKFSDIESEEEMDFATQNLRYNGILSECKAYYFCTERFRLLTIDKVVFVRQIFEQSLLLFEKKYICQLSNLWFHFEVHLYEMVITGYSRLLSLTPKASKAVFTLGKELLRITSNRDNMILWSLYGQFQWFHGSMKESYRIFDVALLSYDYCLEQEVKSGGLYWRFCRCYSQLLLGIFERPNSPNVTNRQKMLHVLSSGIDPGPQKLDHCNEPLAPVEILRIRRQFTELLTMLKAKVMQNPASKTADAFVELLLSFGLFQYETAGVTDFHKVLTENVGDDLPENLNLAVVQYRISMLLYHIQLKHSHFSLFSATLKEAIAKFPENFPLLCLYAKNVRSSIGCLDLRKHHQESRRDAISVTSCLGAIMYELARLNRTKVFTFQGGTGDTAGLNKDDKVVHTILPATGIVNRIRALFLRAVETTDGRNCAALWRMYLEFENTHGESKEAESIFYQALQRCPWSKNLYLDAIKYFPKHFQSILDIMQEKEIRICLPVEELDIIMEQ